MQIGDAFYDKFWTPVKDSFINRMYYIFYNQKQKTKYFCFKEDNWIDKAGGWIKDNTGIDLSSHEDTKKWFQKAARKIGADFDISGNCYIEYGETID